MLDVNGILGEFDESVIDFFADTSCDDICIRLVHQLRGELRRHRQQFCFSTRYVVGPSIHYVIDVDQFAATNRVFYR